MKRDSRSLVAPGASFVVAVLALVLAVPVSAAPVQPPAPEATQEAARQPAFGETVDVNIVNLEVIVTDRGRPVLDLGRDDFEILDDGEPIEITNFYAVNERFVAEAEAAVAAGAGEAQRRDPLDRDSIVIVVDNTFIGPSERKQVFLALERELDRLLKPGTQVMVVDKDHTIAIEQAFTTDREAIETALQGIAKRGGSSAMRRASERAILRDIALGSQALDDGAETEGFGFGPQEIGVADAVMTLNQISAYASETFQDVHRTVQSLRVFFNSLSGLPGRKSVLYVSDGLPLRPAEFLFDAWFDKYAAYSDEAGATSADDAVAAYDTTEEVVDLVADASANRIAFYTISSGLRASNSSSSVRDSGFRDITRVAAEQMTPDLQGLMLLARSTGGETATELGSVASLVEQVETDLSSYYSLGYASPHGGDGKVHKVEVRVKRPGVEVRYLDTYRDKNSDQRMGDRTLSALFLESGANPLDVRVEIKDMQREKKDRWLVPIEVRLPLAKVAMVPDQASHVGSVSVFIVVRDDEGRISDPQKVHLPVSIPNDSFAAAMTGMAAYATQIRMRAGEQMLGVGVRDDLTEVGSTVNVKLNVGKQQG